MQNAYGIVYVDLNRGVTFLTLIWFWIWDMSKFQRKVEEGWGSFGFNWPVYKKIIIKHQKYI